jgi:amino acid transporter
MRAAEQTTLRKELGLLDLALAQVLCVVGSSWVGIAAKLGRAHLLFWLGAMALFFLPLAAVVIHLNRLMPLEGGLYQWARRGFGDFLGFLTAWNLWVYAVTSTASVIFVIPTDLAYAGTVTRQSIGVIRIARPPGLGPDYNAGGREKLECISQLPSGMCYRLLASFLLREPPQTMPTPTAGHESKDSTDPPPHASLSPAASPQEL